MGIVKALEIDGLDCRVLFKQLGLDFDALEDPDARFPQDSMTRLWQRAVELSGNPAIGLNMGKVVRPASFHVAGYALMSSRTLAEGFQRLVRYQRIIAESADLSFSSVGRGLWADPDGAWRPFTPPLGKVPRRPWPVRWPCATG
nr:hypothetical protein GCM10020185_10560 [Pseudomonas brassicacearum subsp. brassicacearum]